MGLIVIVIMLDTIFLTDSVSEVADTYTTATDQIVLEFDTFEDILLSSTESDQSKKFKFQVVVKVIRNYQLSLLQLQLELVHHFLQPQKILVQARSIKITDPEALTMLEQIHQMQPLERLLCS